MGIVFTDGACIGNGRADATGGIGVHFGKNHAWNYCRRYQGSLAPFGHPVSRVTNQTMELMAAIVALGLIRDQPGRERWLLLTDSEYMVKSMETWIKGWEKNGFKTRFGRPVKNETLLKELRRLQLAVGVDFQHTPAHRPHPGPGASAQEVARHAGNAAADALAKSVLSRPANVLSRPASAEHRPASHKPPVGPMDMFVVLRK